MFYLYYKSSQDFIVFLLGTYCKIVAYLGPGRKSEMRYSLKLLVLSWKHCVFDVFLEGRKTLSTLFLIYKVSYLLSAVFSVLNRVSLPELRPRLMSF